MYNGHVYKFTARFFDEKYPFIIQDSKSNQGIPFGEMQRMVYGEKPIDYGIFKDVDISVRSKSRKFDFLRFGSSLLISEGAKALLDGRTTDDVEFIPLKVNGESWYCIFVTKVIDCLDYSKSVVEYFPGNKIIERISRYSFQHERLTDPLIFRIPEKYYMFTTDSVKKAVEGSSLYGHYFLDFEDPPEQEELW